MRLSFNCPNPSDGTAFYRVFGPLGHLQRNFGDYDILPAGQVNVNNCLFSDVAFFQRPATYQEVEAMKMFKRAKVPVIVDYDDNDLNVPSDFPSYLHFSDPDVRNAMLYSMEMADAVTVTTQALKEEINRIYPNQRVFVVPNALDPVFHSEQREPKTDTILWRGGVSHQRDLWKVAPDLHQFCKDHKNVFTFYGYYPWFLEDLLPKDRFSVEPWQKTCANYLARLSQISPKYGLVPLHDNGFNRCKSNIAWLELTWAGAVCLVPNWPEFDHPGAITYSGPAEFYSKLESLVSMPDELLALSRREAWKWIKANATLASVNDYRNDIFRAAYGAIDWPKETDFMSWKNQYHSQIQAENKLEDHSKGVGV